MTDFSKLTISSAIKGLKKKDFTSLELTKFFIDKIQDKIELNCFITNTFEIALKMAKNADHRIMSKKNRILEFSKFGDFVLISFMILKMVSKRLTYLPGGKGGEGRQGKRIYLTS